MRVRCRFASTRIRACGGRLPRRDFGRPTLRRRGFGRGFEGTVHWVRTDSHPLDNHLVTADGAEGHQPQHDTGAHEHPNGYELRPRGQRDVEGLSGPLQAAPHPCVIARCTKAGAVGGLSLRARLSAPVARCHASRTARALPRTREGPRPCRCPGAAPAGLWRLRASMEIHARPNRCADAFCIELRIGDLRHRDTPWANHRSAQGVSKAQIWQSTWCSY